MPRDPLVAAFDPKVRARLRGLIKDGEQHWVGGTVNYSSNPCDYNPDGDGLKDYDS